MDKHVIDLASELSSCLTESEQQCKLGKYKYTVDRTVHIELP